MDTDAILGKITEYCKARTELDETLKKAMTKVANGTATYAEARSVAAAQGKILEDAFRRYLPEALTDGYLYREYAEKLIIKPVEQSVKVIDQAAEDIQAMLNKSAGIGINPIVPDLNTDQLNGIVTGIVNENFQNGKELFFDQIGNLLEGHVDDFVHDNADFQYQAGLEATIERTVSRNCCSWCAKMAGRYKYSDVADRGNDVWRRHNNCHCEILFNPADGSKKRQNVHTKRWTDGEKADRIKLSQGSDESERSNDGNRSQIKLNLQQFASKSGAYRAAMYRSEWKKGSLNETIQRFTPDATKSENKKKGKVFYDGSDCRYRIVYDRNGNYFRILDKQSKSRKKPYVGLNGESLLNKTENGRTVGRSNDEYEKVSHFMNID